jgi:hypothetical protein
MVRASRVLGWSSKLPSSSGDPVLEKLVLATDVSPDAEFASRLAIDMSN